MNNASHLHAHGGFLRPSADVIARRLGEAAVLVHLPSNRIFELNATGARIWDLLCEGVEPAHIQERLVAEFTVDAAQAARELGDLLGRLRDEGLLES